jgi:hypothetical protein
LTTNFTPTPKVSFLTVNFHQPEVTLQLLQSLSQLTYPNWECIVVNNSEAEPLLEEEVKNQANIKYINTGANLGFAGGNNAGLHLCNGELIYFINNDVEVEPDLLQPIIDCFNTHPNIGMLSTKIIFFDEKNVVQYAGATELNPYTLRNKGIGFGEKDNRAFDECYTTAFIHGASMVVPKQVIDKVGPMYDDYFLYYEEYDWCERVKKAGYTIFYCGTSKVYHKESISTGANSPLKTYYLSRNRILFARRNFNGASKAVSMIYLWAIALPIHLLKRALKREWKQAVAMLRGYFWNLTHKAVSSDSRN